MQGSDWLRNHLAALFNVEKIYSLQRLRTLVFTLSRAEKVLKKLNFLKPRFIETHFFAKVSENFSSLTSCNHNRKPYTGFESFCLCLLIQANLQW
jgi:hypothetical protein